MALFRTRSAAIFGIDAHLIDVEVDMYPGQNRDFITVGILGAMGVVGPAEDHLFVGELSLDGAIRPVRGALSIAACARGKGIKNLLVPADNAAEAAVADGVRVFGMRHLCEVVAFLRKPEGFEPYAGSAPLPA